MPTIVFTKLKNQPTDKALQAKIFTFIQKLTNDDTSPGLHIEKMNHAADSRARTARVDGGWRAVLYKLDSRGADRTYLYAGTWEHDEAIIRAQTIKLGVNDVNGVVELIEAAEPTVRVAPSAPGAAGPAATEAPVSFLSSSYNYVLTDLMDELGFDAPTAALLIGATSEDELIDVVDDLENAWQQTAGLGLAVGDSLDKIRADLALAAPRPSAATVDLTEDERILDALTSGASRMQFTFIRSDDELRRIIDDGDFGTWRVFLHPEQERYARGHWNGPFRLSGGAGTGKTVVLLHRARALALGSPRSSTVLCTYTRALGDNLSRDLDHLDPDVPRATAIGGAGVLVRGVDQLVVAVRDLATEDFESASADIFGVEVDRHGSLRSNDHGWQDAIDAVRPELPEEVLAPSFFVGEYLQVVLPSRITTRDEFLTVRRPGRGAALDRRKRDAVWRVIERYRADARTLGTISWAELAAVAAAWLDRHPDLPAAHADHVLVDEGQDLTPSQWQFLRALAKQGTDDLFIAEDSHQRIYGQHVVLSRYGIAITGRARRLTLNYRTTAQNLQYALAVLRGATYVDPEGGEESVTGYRSARRGPSPLLLGAASDSDQLHDVGGLVRAWLHDGVEPASVAILTRTNDRATAVRDSLSRQGIAVDHLKTATESGEKPRVLTMHTAKGMEFSRVILFDVSDGAIPLPWMLKNAAPADRDDVMVRERSLLYVAASRARDELVITWRQAPSSLLASETP